MSNSINTQVPNTEPSLADIEADLDNGASKEKFKKDGQAFLKELSGGADPAEADAVNNMDKSVDDGTFDKDRTKIALQFAYLKDIANQPPSSPSSITFSSAPSSPGPLTPSSPATSQVPNNEPLWADLNEDFENGASNKKLQEDGQTFLNQRGGLTQLRQMP